MGAVGAGGGGGAGPPPPPPPPPPANTPPSFLEGERAVRSIPENTTSGEDIGLPFEASDPDLGDTLTYTLDGDDAEYFDIDGSSGQLMTKTALDYETKASYALTVRVADRSGAGDAIEVTVTVTNLGLAGTVGRYDTDDNGTIDRDEAIAAVADYFNGVISREEALEVISAYFDG